MFQVGEFSKIAQVSKRLLHYYDEIGLLKPEHTDEQTGYRFYSAAQLPRLNQILALKELGLNLEQIARMLDDNVAVDEIRGMLALKKAQVEQSVHEEIMRLRYIESRISQIDTEGGLHDYGVVLKSVPRQRVLTTRELLPDFSGFRHIMYEMMRLLPARVGRGALGHMIAFVHNDGWQDEDIDAEMGYIVTGDIPDSLSLPDGRELHIRTLPAVEMMATTTRVGPGKLGSGCYHALGRWIEDNGYRITGVGREVFLQLQPDRDEEMVTDIQLPVERISLSNPLLS